MPHVDGILRRVGKSAQHGAHRQLIRVGTAQTGVNALSAPLPTYHLWLVWPRGNTGRKTPVGVIQPPTTRAIVVPLKGCRAT
jgi:hypothetical protein